MKKKEQNPIEFSSYDISLAELKNLTNYDENDNNIKQSLQQIKKFYSLLYQHKPTDNISKLLKENLIHNKYKYYEIKYNKKENILATLWLLYTLMASAAFIVGVASGSTEVILFGTNLFLGGFIMLKYICSWFENCYGRLLMYYSDGVSNDEDYV